MHTSLCSEVMMNIFGIYTSSSTRLLGIQFFHEIEQLATERTLLRESWQAIAIRCATGSADT